MTFNEYLTAKKIDSGVFRQCEPQRWSEYENVFGQVHPDSFTTQKKFVINDLRRLYHLKPAEPENATVAPEKKTARPMMRPAVAKTDTEAAEIACLPDRQVSPGNAKPTLAAEPEAQPKKPAKPVIRPLMGKTVATETGKEMAGEKIVSPENGKPADGETGEMPAVKKPARPVMRPIVRPAQEL